MKLAMNDNIQQAMANVDAAELLNAEIIPMQEQAAQFHKSATEAKRQQCCIYYKVQFMIAAVVGFILLVIVISITSG